MGEAEITFDKGKDDRSEYAIFIGDKLTSSSETSEQVEERWEKFIKENGYLLEEGL